MFFLCYFLLSCHSMYLLNYKKERQGKKLGLLKSSCEVTVINEEEFHLQLYFL